MGYTVRQQHCLKAMGLVAWVHRESVKAEPPAAESSTAIENVSTSTSTGAQRSPESQNVGFPSDLTAQAQWLVTQPLVSFNYRGQSVLSAGMSSSALLVVCLEPVDAAADATDTDQLLPLSAEAGQLFDLMMRAIGVSRSALVQCVVSMNKTSADPSTTPAAEGASGSDNAKYVQSLLAAGPRAVLVLDPTDPAAAASEINHQRCVLPDSSTALWRVPHPQLLLQTPMLKRQAWESLKGLQNELNG